MKNFLKASVVYFTYVETVTGNTVIIKDITILIILTCIC